MSEKNDFEENLKAILDADDSVEENIPNKSIKKKKTDDNSPLLSTSKEQTKRYPSWATLVVRAAAGIAFILLLLKYALNIAYR